MVIAPEGPGRLVVVVDPGLGSLHVLSSVLRFQGFVISVATDARSLRRGLRQGSPDLIVLTVHLPDANGVGLCRELRMDGLDTGIVLIGRSGDSCSEKVTALTYADDYVTEPYEVEEVVARVRAVLRRARATGPTPLVSEGNGRRPHSPAVQRYADVELDTQLFQARRAGQSFEVSPTEFRLLSYFICNPRRVLSRGEILRRVWGPDFIGEPAIVDTYVSYLRRKLHIGGPPLIHTRRGFGYVLSAAKDDGCGPSGVTASTDWA